MSTRLLAAIAACLALGAIPSGSTVIHVHTGEDLQAAIDGAQSGDTIALDRGATFVGNFVLPVKPGADYITIRTDGDDGLPAAGVRVAPDDAPLLAKIKSPNTSATLRTAPGAHHWRLLLLEFQANLKGRGDIILLGSGDRDQNSLDVVPHDLSVDRCYVHGDPDVGQKRGIALNSASTEVVNSYISDIKAIGQDSQALGGWNGPGPFRIENNYLEAAGENFLMGGAATYIDGLIPSDINFRSNHLAKPLDWRKSRWQVKNLFELKNARRVFVEGNVFEYNWQAAQAGYAIIFTPRSSDNVVPWATVEDVNFHSNIVRHVAAVFNILGTDDARTSGPGRRIRITDNVFYDVSRTWGGNGSFMQIGLGPSDVVVQHNTVMQTGNIIGAYGGTKQSPTQSVGFVFTDNLTRNNQYGVIGAGHAPGNETLGAFFINPVFTHNVLAGGKASLYPGGNFFPSLADFDAQFVNAGEGDLRLVPDSAFRGRASDGSDLGAHVEQVLRTSAAAVARDRVRPVPPRRTDGRGVGGSVPR
jgi:hypothetical protein